LFQALLVLQEDLDYLDLLVSRVAGVILDHKEIQASEGSLDFRYIWLK
jgi:hypothetical protein